MKKNNHDIYKSHPTTIVVFFIVAIVFVFSLLTIYYYQQYKIASLQPTPTTSLTPDSTADSSVKALATMDWQIYRDDHLGLEFKYPPTWSSPSSNPLSTRTEIVFGQANGRERQQDQTNIAKLTISIGFFYNQDLQEKITLDQYLKEDQNFTLDDFIGTCHTYYMDDFGFYRTEITMAESYNSTNIISISYRHPVDKSNPEIIDSTVFDQILSTFKFLD